MDFKQAFDIVCNVGAYGKIHEDLQHIQMIRLNLLNVQVSLKIHLNNIDYDSLGYIQSIFTHKKKTAWKNIWNSHSCPNHK